MLAKHTLNWPLLFAGEIPLPYGFDPDSFDDGDGFGFGLTNGGTECGDGYGDSPFGQGDGSGRGAGYTFVQSGNGMDNSLDRYSK